ncbi:MAG: TauD/TfdA family dioxygenase [Rhodospirillales bacterium]|jgi:alpha-ketoglutarate-dependent 2,4-dichlorophenoxyacetate dioxygenase|nr:TauD/TfdA family dioxygenase [Rhodospirillales bacterium]
MGLQATPLHPLFGARISGMDIREPVSVAQSQAFIALMDQFGVCVVGHDAPPTNEEQIEFSALLGPMDRGKSPKITGTGIRIPHNEMVDQSNLDQDGAIYEEGDRRLLFKRANRLWHTDMSFRQVRGTYSLLSAHVIPPMGGNTEFVDTRAVYDALPEQTKNRLDGLIAEHCYWHSRALGGAEPPTEAERASRPPAHHGLVYHCEKTGRKALYIASHISAIKGWPENEARDLLDELMAFATRPEFIYSHKWRVGDVVVWDNLATIHRATPFDDTQYRRDMRRSTCREQLVHS